MISSIRNFPLPPGFSLTPAGETQGAGQAPAAQPSAVEEEFLKFARMTPGERIRDAILSEFDLTEADLEKMDPKERAAIEKQIAERIKEKLEQGPEKRPGMLLDMSA